MQFYILMVDYGKGPQRPMGFEAVVQPELTRRQIIEQARDFLARGRNVAFIKFVDGNFIEDQTAELMAEAAAMEAA